MMQTNGTTAGPSQVTIRIIVHPEGELDMRGQGYWTEVVEMPRCMAHGGTEAEVTERTKENIYRYSSSEEVNVVVERAL